MPDFKKASESSLSTNVQAAQKYHPVTDERVPYEKPRPAPLPGIFNGLRRLAAEQWPNVIESDVAPRTVQQVIPASAYAKREVLEQLPFGVLQELRAQPGANQEYLGPIEHGAFVRETIRDPPIVSVLGRDIPVDSSVMANVQAISTPVYSGLKNVGFMPRTRTAGSVEEIKGGYRGIYQGLRDLSR